MNEDTKTSKYYSTAKMQHALLMMEQFYLLSEDISLTEKERTCAKRLFEHHRRLAMCILMKEMPEKFESELFVDRDYMANMFKKYVQ